MDRSLSLAGCRQLICAFVRLLSHLVDSFEVFGYTTRHWLGGNSYRSWRQRRPLNPGRLNDVLYVKGIYDSNTFNLIPLMRREVMKENIDGEALLSLCSAERPNVLICDNLPADLKTNELNNPLLLPNHFQEAQTLSRKLSLLKLNFGASNEAVGWINITRRSKRSALLQLVRHLSVRLTSAA
ncbi:MAG: cobaltochelatase CobT-related protein [Candidatus Hodgkinia cicadicola]